MSKIDNQTGLLSTMFDSPTDAISELLNVDHVCRRFVMTSFFSVAASKYNGSFWVFGVFTVNSFSLVDQMMLMSLDEYFSNCFEWLSLAW